MDLYEHLAEVGEVAAQDRLATTARDNFLELLFQVRWEAIAAPEPTFGAHQNRAGRSKRTDPVPKPYKAQLVAPYVVDSAQVRW